MWKSRQMHIKFLHYLLNNNKKGIKNMSYTSFSSQQRLLQGILWYFLGNFYTIEHKNSSFQDHLWQGSLNETLSLDTNWRQVEIESGKTLYFHFHCRLFIVRSDTNARIKISMYDILAPIHQQMMELSAHLTLERLLPPQQGIIDLFRTCKSTAKETK